MGQLASLRTAWRGREKDVEGDQIFQYLSPGNAKSDGDVPEEGLVVYHRLAIADAGREYHCENVRAFLAIAWVYIGASTGAAESAGG